MPHLERGIVQVYTGDGKGKTTASMGLAMRAVGSGLKAIVIQFMKSGHYSGELDPLERLGVRVFQYGRPCAPMPDGSPNPQCFQPHPDDRKYAQDGLEHASKAVMSGEYDVAILDEINFAVFMKNVDEGQVLGLIGNKPNALELILTGRNATEKIKGKADLVTEMREIKHPYNDGLMARKGIEY